MAEILYGRNAAREALRARRRHIHRLLLADKIEPAEIIDEIVALANQLRLPIEAVPRKKLDSMARHHQGVILKTGRYPTVDLEDILDRAGNEPPFILVLDHIEDPHNLGAILRTAEIVGVHGVIIPRRRAAGISPTVVNVSSGAAEHMRIAELPNLTRALKTLKQANIWVAGVENDPAAQPYHRADLSGPIALVIGSEGTGLSRLVQETCDFLIKLPMRGKIESLNASVAAGLALYEVWRARKFID